MTSYKAISRVISLINEKDEWLKFEKTAADWTNSEAVRDYVAYAEKYRLDVFAKYETIKSEVLGLGLAPDDRKEIELRFAEVTDYKISNEASLRSHLQSGNPPDFQTTNFLYWDMPSGVVDGALQTVRDELQRIQTGQVETLGAQD